MLRITREDNSKHVLIKIEGRLAGEDVISAETACAEALAAKMPVTVLLNNVLQIDSRGLAFLRELLVKRARVRAVGIYSRYIVRRLGKSNHEPTPNR
jgi:ABC-type transporter Mla MlaB component